MSDLGQVRPCTVQWKPGNRQHPGATDWHVCWFPDDSHTGDHECECGDVANTTTVPVPSTDNPEVRDRQTLLGLVAIIAGVDLLTLAVLVGILTAVLSR